MNYKCLSFIYSCITFIVNIKNLIYSLSQQEYNLYIVGKSFSFFQDYPFLSRIDYILPWIENKRLMVCFSCIISCINKEFSQFSCLYSHIPINSLLLTISRFFFIYAYVVHDLWYAFSAMRARKEAMRIIKVLCPAVHSFCFVGRSHDLPPTLTTSALTDLVHPRTFSTNSPFRCFFLDN